MVERFLPLWLLLLSVAALGWDRTGVFDPFLATKGGVNWLIAGTMLAIGGMLPVEEIRQVRLRWPMVLAGTALQYGSMPLLGFTMAHLFQLSPDAMVGVIMVGCVPGAMASNALTLMARGNVSYSVSLTTLATLLSPLVVPLVLKWTLGKTVEFDAVQAGLGLLWTVVIPVLAGYSVSRLWPAFERFVQRVGQMVANLAILWIIAVVVALNREKMMQIQAPLLSALVMVNALGYAAGWMGGYVFRLPEAMRRALTLEIGMQNAGVGSMLALQLFPDRPETSIPTALYAFGCMLSGTLLARFWSSRPLIASSYSQPEDTTGKI